MVFEAKWDQGHLFQLISFCLLKDRNDHKLFHNLRTYIKKFMNRMIRKGALY